MRTEQFIEGYNSLRYTMQDHINTLRETNNASDFIKEMVKLAEYPYYKSDGKDWDE